MRLASLLRQPSAFLPLLMSTAALAVVLSFLAIHGVVRQQDEGAAAHLWQLLMGGQLPIVAYFAVKWLPRAFGPALGVLVIQAIAGLAAMAPVYLLGF